MDAQENVHQVKSIGFRKLNEDEDNDTEYRVASDKQLGAKLYDSKRRAENLTSFKSNFSLEYTYPAVIFEDICFTIDKTQQKANFLKECQLNLQKLFSKDVSNQKIEILKSINLNVPTGSIFGLLGPSSCGKTTLLRCLVGLLKPTSGNIRLFCNGTNEYGNQPDSDRGGCLTCCCPCSSDSRARSKVPGSNVGYMPQDLGLYEDFTIRQLLMMFGQYMKMSSSLIDERIDFMRRFLDLPDVDRDICSLSGGQKRRVSFAIALIHMPPLIILDEPTVGVDPLLRKSIWKYLRRLASEENKTIIITTHYIEEAAQADQIALMRAGKILVQDTPSRIMNSTRSKTLEEAFLKICNNIQQQQQQQQGAESQDKGLSSADGTVSEQKVTLYPQSKFNWHNQLPVGDPIQSDPIKTTDLHYDSNNKTQFQQRILDEKLNRLSMEPDAVNNTIESRIWNTYNELDTDQDKTLSPTETNNRIRSLRGQKLIINQNVGDKQTRIDTNDKCFDDTNNNNSNCYLHSNHSLEFKKKNFRRSIKRNLTLIWALLYKNYRRNVNSIPLLAFQFMLPIVQMISFSLCVGGKPSNIGLGLVNHDQFMPPRSHLLATENNSTLMNGNNLMNALNDSLSILENGRRTNDSTDGEAYYPISSEEELLSSRFLSFLDRSILDVKTYKTLSEALEDVRRSKLWAVMEIGDNFTTTMLLRFDPDNFSQLDRATMEQAVIKLYPDRSNKILDMICLRSLVDSYRDFLLHEFEHLKKLPIDVKEAIYSIRPNLISNSIGGYTESIAAGLLASLTYIMAAGLTTFIMVVERSAGILERTFTSGINPVAYLIAHAVFRSFVMMLQIAVVMFLTFYLLKQPLVGSIWLAYTMLMVLNLTGITYGLLVSSIVTDQNGAALTIVSSLVVKITLSGILWPFEAIPRWLRLLCYIQPLTMPIQALKAITLKGSGLQDRVVQFGFLVSISWLLVFLVISAKRFKFYQY